jgi:hypothetical protein
VSGEYTIYRQELRLMETYPNGQIAVQLVFTEPLSVSDKVCNAEKVANDGLIKLLSGDVCLPRNHNRWIKNELLFARLQITSIGDLEVLKWNSQLSSISNGIELDLTSLEDVDINRLITLISSAPVPISVRISCSSNRLLLIRHAQELANPIIFFLHVVDMDQSPGLGSPVDEAIQTISSCFQGNYVVSKSTIIKYNIRRISGINSFKDLDGARHRGPLTVRRTTGYQDLGGMYRMTTNVEHETRSLMFYGWAILVSAWMIFIGGMGSILGLWDRLVGYETSTIQLYVDYEEETGLPIRNYYSLLVFLCSVVLWVWCVVSWMGLKFFRHAKGSSNGTR